MSRLGILTLAVLLPAGMLIGCSEHNESEIKDWMEGVKKEVRPSVQPIAEPKKFIPFGYMHKDEVDPFDPNKLMVAIARLNATTKKNGPVIDQTRPREVLEGFPMDALKMVGTLEKKGVFVALIQSDKNIYQVRVGNYMGQNHGKVVKITENNIEIKEIVQDPTGENVERDTKLELQESKNDGK